ncbi:MAG: PLP-dependent aminotransferase family protein, partial [Eubacterium sp.]|nr:PLP-dependent aminotransferase family protein [Eubacterium sp.]
MLSIEFAKNGTPQYIQLYEYIKNEILIGRIAAGQRLPSLREATEILDVSLTTVRSAYDQLLLEGYIISKPQSGYFASELNAGNVGTASASHDYDITKLDTSENKPAYKYDLSSFDFVKWKKCMAAVLNETPEALLTEGDRQGEPELRSEISKYIFRARGVYAEPDQIVIAAGTQQLMGLLSRILNETGIRTVAVEDPGYEPVRSIFKDRGFNTVLVPVKSDGISIEELPAGERTAVYVSPSNQFPTGSVMPAGRRYKLMEWADRTGSIIIEDDYDSELRYFGRPIPPIRALRPDPDVVYLGSFSSTLFSAIRISYMVLPGNMAGV